MLRIGMLLADRYEILQQIGSGGMAYVYRAKDHKLNRYVAIKVLKEEYCRDKNFVTKFRMEAQAAAGLSHANIVGVYDVGEISSVYFIVMELIEGITLKEYINRKKKLGVKESIGVAIQVAQGLEAAHNRHLVHRDIKPQNIIISRDGKIKVTDFGIARAITDETTNMYKAAGSVHYISPEQARGGYCDERSDIYSLGITMYEMVTGHVPFDGETTVAVAIAHMNEAIVPPSRMEPTVPLALEQIILKCVQKRPERRYSTCGELIADLRQAIVTPQDGFVHFSSEGDDYIATADEERAMEAQPSQPATHDTIQMTPLPVRSQQSVRQDYYGERDYEEGTDFSSLSSRKNSQTRQVKRPAEQLYRTQKQGTGKPRNNYYETPARQQTRPPRREEEREPVRRQDKAATAFDRVLLGIGSIFGIIILLMSVYIGVSLGGLFSSGNSGKKNTAAPVTVSSSEELETATTQKAKEGETLSDKQTRVPDLLGCTLDEATLLMEEAGLQIKVSRSYGYSDEYEAGLICKQQYAKDTVIDKNSRVTVTLSLGSDKFYLDGEKYIGSNINVLQYELNSYPDIESETITTPDETTKKGTILKLEPESGYLAPGDSLKIYVSQGPTKIDVPDLTNLSQGQAISKLEGVGLYVGNILQDYSSTVSAGLVCGQSPAAWTTVEVGSSVDIVISLGKPSYQVPSVWGMSEADARATLEASHLSCNFVWESSNEAGQGTAFKQDIAAGSWVEEWTTVTVTISTGPEAFSIDVECVKDMTQEEATAYLQSLGLNVGEVIWKANQYVAAGYATVISTPDWSNTVHKGDTVTLYMSTGPDVIPSQTDPAVPSTTAWSDPAAQQEPAQ